MTTDKLPWPGNSLIPNVPHELYHSDPWGDVPCLSQSVATQLLKCPLKGWAAHPRLGGAKDKAATKAQKGGTLGHALLLGSGPQLKVFPYADWRKNVAKEDKEDAILNGLTPVLQHEYDEALASSTAILYNLREREGVDFGELDTEMSMLWTDPNLGVRCRGRIDGYDSARGHVFDPKFTSLEPDAWVAGMKRSGYDVQAMAYLEAIETIFPDLAGRGQFTFLLIHPEFPYTTCSVTMGGTMRSLGEDRWTRAKLSWKEGLETRRWRSYLPVIAEARAYELQEELLRSIETVEDAYGGG